MSGDQCDVCGGQLAEGDHSHPRFREGQRTERMRELVAEGYTWAEALKLTEGGA